MKECTDSRFEEMLPLYELNLLPEKDKEDFELHLYECEHCFQAVREFRDKALLINYDQDVRAIVAEASARTETAGERTRAKPGSFFARKFRSTVVPASIVVVVVLLVLILKPWHLEFEPTKEAVAFENRLAVMYFDNLTDRDDPERLGEIITGLLITDLSESKYVQVISSQRLYDILKLIGMEGTKSISRDVATRIARKAQAKWMLLGEVIEKEPFVVITSRLVEVATGDVIAGQKVEGRANESIFSLVDKLTAEIKNDLALPDEAGLEPDRMISDITTDSRAAYRHYLEGVEYYQKFYFDDAKRSFEKVLEYDSTFAMAYYYLTGLKDSKLIDKAVQYRDNAGRIDRLYIDIARAEHSGDKIRERELLKEMVEDYPDEKQAFHLLGLCKYRLRDYDSAVIYFSRALELDPLYKEVYNHLAYTYSAAGNFEMALGAIDKYAEIAPDEANPYDSKGDLYAANGMLDNAVQSYRMALKIKPDFYWPFHKLALMYLYKKEFATADSCYRILLSPRFVNFRTDVMFYRTYVSLFQGKFKETLRYIDSLISADEENYASYYFIKSQIHVEMKRWDAALSEIETAIRVHAERFPDRNTAYKPAHIQILAGKGDYARAEQGVEELKVSLEQMGDMTGYWLSLGRIEMTKGNYAKAVSYFENITQRSLAFCTGYMCAEAYLLAGRPRDAIPIFEKIDRMHDYDRALNGVWTVKINYYLGVAYEDIGDYEMAIGYYEEFLAFWKDSDPGIESKQDARERLARLRTNL
ncbi:MAG: tetratricopeptide repeat protein [Candidatus Zixiibacteriota bacterium]|nr:MAG: tetratricopeptide repeat protein [candidate division Zixibacteria bacterium]